MCAAVSEPGLSTPETPAALPWEAKEVATLDGHGDRAWCVAWSPDGQLLASCGQDKVVRIWQGPQPGDRDQSGGSAQPAWKLVCSLDDGPTRTVRRVAWSPCGKLLAGSSFDGSAVVWERRSSGTSLDFEMLSQLEGHENEVKGVAFSPSGRYLATSGRDKTVWIWEGEAEGEFECISVLPKHTGDVKSVAWVGSGEDDEYVVSCGYDDSAMVWAERMDDWMHVETIGTPSTAWECAVEPRRDGSEGGGPGSLGRAPGALGQRLAVCDGAGGVSVLQQRGGPDGGQDSTLSKEKEKQVVRSSEPGARARGWSRAGRWVQADVDVVYSADWARPGGMDVLALGDDSDSIRLVQVVPSPAAEGSARSVPKRDTDRKAEDEEAGSGADSSSIGFVSLAVVEDAHAGDVNCVRWRPGRSSAAGAAVGGDGEGDGPSGPHAMQIASAGDDGVIRVWEVRPRQESAPGSGAGSGSGGGTEREEP